MKYALIVGLALAANVAQVVYLHHRWQEERAAEWTDYTKQEDRRREERKAQALAVAEAERQAAAAAAKAAKKARENAIADCLMGLILGSAAAYTAGDPSGLLTAVPTCAKLL